MEIRGHEQIERREIVQLTGEMPSDAQALPLAAYGVDAASNEAVPPSRFAKYVDDCPCLKHFFVGDAKAAESVALAVHAPATIRKWSEPPPVHPPEAAVVGGYRMQQRYLDEEGIHIRPAKDEPKRDVRLIDIEQGWNLEHQELAGRVRQLGSDTGRFHGHGTSVLGILIGNRKDKRGIEGIMPSHLTVGVVSQYWPAEKEGKYCYSTAQAIFEAIHSKFLSEGDVLLIEAQHWDEKTGFLLPVEADPLVRCAIECAVSKGYVVIEPAGNGGVDLGSADMEGRFGFSQSSPSGAIIVGAATSDPEHEALFFSNRGRIVNCYAWGESVTTCGDGETSREVDEYIPDFGGTSAAAAIITGVAALTQSIARGMDMPLTGTELRDLLVNPLYGTPPVAHSAPIGVMPNMAKLVERLKEMKTERAPAPPVVSPVPPENASSRTKKK